MEIGPHLYRYLVSFINFCSLSGANKIHFYIDEQNDSIVALQGDIINNVKTKLILQFHPIETLHISLSKTVPIKFHWIKPFIHSLQNNIGFDTKK